MSEADFSTPELAHARSPRLKRALGAGAAVVWVLAVGFGLVTLWNYENAPGAPATAPAEWPSASRLPRPQDRAALVMFLHPQCPCSEASVAELARLMARTEGELDAHVLFLAPPDAPDTWVQSDLWRAAAAIPGVHVARDEQGAEAVRFGALTSGESMVYDRRGRLQFNGGLTASRGHEGDNAGRSAVESILAGRPARRTTFTFGCALFDAEHNAKNGSR